MLQPLGCCRYRYGATTRFGCALQVGKLMLALMAGMAHAGPGGLISVTDLTGSATAAPWSLANANGSFALPGVSLPAYVLDVLEDRHLIPNPLQRFNERELAWVRDDTWTFSREFTVDAWAGGELVLSGVDTIGDVTLNGKPLARVANEFRVHRIALKPEDLLTGGKPNKLSITLQPVKLEAERLAKAYPYVVPSIAHVGSFAEHKGYIRKAGADFGWDWGPALGPAGIFGSVYLLAAADTGDKPNGNAGSYLQYALVRQRFEQDHVTLINHLVISRPAGAAASAAPVSGSARLSIPELGVDVTKALTPEAAATACKPATSGQAGALECDLIFEVEVPKAKVQLWWPYGHGPQKLYKATILWSPAGGPAECTSAPIYDSDEPTEGAVAAPAAKKFGCSVARREIGFRTVELVTLPPAEAAKELAPGTAAPTGADADGETMYVRVNGVAMFMKGANLIPFHTVRTQVTDARVMATLQAALDVNFNVLRVWGGGIYLPNDFYAAADRLGLLLWQESMFACAMYPADKEFLANVREEMKEQVLRLGSHPSVAIWGGNNENEVGFNWFAESRNNRPFYQAEYVKLYFDTIGDVVTNLLPEMPYVDSSPANGPFYTGVSADGKYSKPLPELLRIKRWGDAGSAKWGDVHFYNHEDDCTQYGIVPEARMMSEFGWQSDAPWFSIKHVTPPEDWDTWAPAAQYRQRWNTDGTRIKTEQMGRVLGGLPAHGFKAQSSAQRAEEYSDWIYLRQVQQSVCHDYTISMLRRKMRDPSKGSMGSLYWQLNDVWQGASWSTVDYELRWKPAHYLLKRVYAPVQVIAYNPPSDPGRIYVEVQYDEALPLPAPINVKLYLEPLAAPAGAQCAKGELVGEFTAEQGSASGQVEWSSRVNAILAKRRGCTRTTCYLRVVATEGPAAPNAVLSRRGPGTLLGLKAGEPQVSELWFAKYGKLALPEVTVAASGFKQVGPRKVKFTIESRGGAAVEAYWDTEPAGHFSTNSITLLPCEKVEVTFEAVKDVSAADVEKWLTVWTINGALQGKQKGARADFVSGRGGAPSHHHRLSRRLSWLA